MDAVAKVSHPSVTKVDISKVRIAHVYVEYIIKNKLKVSLLHMYM